MNIKTILMTSVAAAALVAFAAPAMAGADNFQTGQPKVKLKLYGQVNKAIMWGDDGNNSRTFIGDNAGGSSTRMGFLAEAPVNADFSFGALIETEWRENSLRAVSIEETANATGGNGDYNKGDASWVIRHQDVFATHKRFGKVSLGQGSNAADTTMESNLSGATMVTGVGATLNGTATLLFNGTTDIHTATTLGSMMTYFAAQGAGRTDRVRYDTPAFMGFNLAGSFASGGVGEVAGYYKNKIGQFDLDGRLGYSALGSISTVADDTISGSLAVMHSSGVNASISGGRIAYKEASPGAVSRSNSSFMGGSVGYVAKIFGVGPTAFAVDYYTTDDAVNTTVNSVSANVAGNGWDTTSFGIGVQQNFADIGADVYLGYRNFDVSAPSTYTGSTDDVNVVITGVRVSF